LQRTTLISIFAQSDFNVLAKHEKMKRNVIAVLMLFSMTLTALPCTTAIVSGKYTVDGRPLMLKNRDRSGSDNVFVTGNSGKYAWTAVVPISDKSDRGVMYGQNEVGLVVMNSTSYNLEQKTTNELKRGNIMCWALERCATVDEFEAMIAEMKYFSYGSNYGVMDAQGHVAYFECGHLGYKKFDADDPTVAPHGYIIRSNFGMTGDIKEGKGFARYQKATDILEKAYQQKNISWKTLLSMARCLEHGMTKVNLYDQMPADENDELVVSFADFIPRYSTMSTYMVQGVKAGENPSLTTGWTCISCPIVSVAIPIWWTKESLFPQVVRRDENGRCLLVDWANTFKSYIWPWEYSDGQSYIRLGRLINKSGTGIMQQILPVEEEILKRGEKLQTQFYKKRHVDADKLKSYYEWVDEFVAKEYQKIGDSHHLKKN